MERAIEKPKYTIYVKKHSEVVIEMHFTKKTSFAIGLPRKLQVQFDTTHEVEVIDRSKKKAVYSLYPCI